MTFAFLNNFGLGANPPEHGIFDSTNYAGQSINPANVSGLFKLTGPAGVYYQNAGYINNNFGSPDIAPPGTTPGLDFVNPLPLNGDNEVEQGDYYLDYKIQVAGQVFTAPIAGITQNFTVVVVGNVAADILTAGVLDIISSTGNDGTYNVTAAVYNAGLNRTTITVVQVLPSGVANGQIQYAVDKIYQATQVTLTYNIDEPCAKLEITADCGCAKLQSRDVTVYGLWSVVQRTHTLIYPVGSGVADVVSSSALIQISDLYTNTYVGQLSVDIGYSPSTGFTITDTITGQKDMKVVCDAGMCCIYSCIRAVIFKYNDLVANGNQAEANRYFNIITRIFGRWMLYSIAHTCGNEDEMAAHIAAIKALIDTECGDCGCNDDCNDGATTQVIPICGPSGGGGGPTQIYSVVACNGNNLLTVTPNTVNDTTTFTVCVSEANMTAFIQSIIANTSIGDLSDVEISAPAEGNTLVWNNILQVWQNTFLDLSQLGDVDTVTNPPATGDILVWNNITGKWEPQRNDGILYNVQGLVGTDNGVGNWQELYAYDVPAGSLDVDGSEVRFTTGLIMNPAENDFVGARVSVDGEGIEAHPIVTNPDQELLRSKGAKGAVMAYAEFRVIRLSATTVKVIVRVNLYVGFLFLAQYTYFNEFNSIITVANLDTNDLPIVVEGRNETLAASDKVQSTHLMVERVIKII